jgi:hypothetical protein
MTIDSASTLSRRRLVGGALAALGAAVGASLAGAQRVFGAGDDTKIIHVADQLDDVQSVTRLRNATNDQAVFVGLNLQNGFGLMGISQNGSGVYGQANTSLGIGVQGVNHDDGGTALQGYKDIPGIAVNALIEDNTSPSDALNASTSGTGTAVRGISLGGYGGQFEGGKSQLRIVPKGSVGKPSSGAHIKGEIYMDSKSSLFVCTAAGTPGTWKKITMRLV